MDVAAHDWQGRLARVALPPVFPKLVMVLVMVTGSKLINQRVRRTDRWPHQRRYLKMILAIVVAGTCLSVSAARIVEEKGDLTRVGAFRQLAYDKTAFIVHALLTLQYFELEALAHLFEASDYVSQAEFMDYTDYLVKNPAIQYWAWAQWTPASEKKAIETKMRAEGLPGGGI